MSLIGDDAVVGWSKDGSIRPVNLSVGDVLRSAFHFPVEAVCP